jgi:hypothetical protein
MSERAKVVFPLKRDESSYETESVWAERLSETRFRILNSPFFVFDVSYEDVVEAKPEGEILRFVRVLQRSGRSTYRVILQGGRTVEGAILLSGGDRFTTAVATPDACATPRLASVRW